MLNAGKPRAGRGQQRRLSAGLPGLRAGAVTPSDPRDRLKAATSVGKRPLGRRRPCARWQTGGGPHAQRDPRGRPPGRPQTRRPHTGAGPARAADPRRPRTPQTPAPAHRRARTAADPEEAPGRPQTPRPQTQALARTCSGPGEALGTPADPAPADTGLSARPADPLVGALARGAARRAPQGRSRTAPAGKGLDRFRRRPRPGPAALQRGPAPAAFLPGRSRPGRGGGRARPRPAQAARSGTAPCAKVSTGRILFLPNDHLNEEAEAAFLKRSVSEREARLSERRRKRKACSSCPARSIRSYTRRFQ